MDKFYENILTPREQQVMRLLIGGLSNPEIATKLGISVSTVKTHLENAYFKLGVHNRVQATCVCVKYNLL